jgi:peptidyl-prolyl cis-trans isomerase SurA
VVNDDVISVYDLATRMRMVMMSSNIPDTPETRQRIGAQVLRNLIDEKLQLQEAKKQNVSASEEELNKALQQIEKQNNMKSGGLDEFLKIRGIDRGSLVSQLSASLVWAKLVRRQATQQTEISDDEIDDTLKRLKEHASEPQSRVAEIFLAVDNPAQEDETRRLAEKLSEQMRQGARFSAVAQQFSQSATAAVGGDIGWIRPDQLAPELGKAVGQLRPGELSPPIRSGGGFYLMLVVERRNGTGGGEARGQGQGQGQGQTQEVLDIVQVVFHCRRRRAKPRGGRRWSRRKTSARLPRTARPC